MKLSSAQFWSLVLALMSSGTFDLADSQRFGNSYLPSESSATPKATAFFPLTASTDSGSAIATEAGQLTQYGNINGTARWMADSLFGHVLECSRENHNSIVLNPVSIGVSGAFAVNLWFKCNTTDNPGENFAYLLSAFENGTLSQTQPHENWVYDINSLQMLLPQAGHNRSGILRTVIKDYNDANQTSDVDSDGQYNVDSAWPTDAKFLNVSNGAWHMATVATRTDATQGYLVYIDGQQAAQLPVTGAPGVQTPAILAGQTYYLDGGDPIYLRGNIFLCSRSDRDPDRFFSGSIAQLSLYDEALDASSIEALYAAVQSQAAYSTAPLAAPMPAPLAGASSEGTTANTSNATAVTANPASAAATGSPALAVATSPAVADPRTSTVPDVVPATSTATDSSPVAAASQSHTLSKGAIAGAVIGAVAGAVLFVALAALALTKRRKPAGHRRLQEAPSAKFLMHSNSMPNSTPKEGQNKLFQAEGSDKYNIKAIP